MQKAKLGINIAGAILAVVNMIVLIALNVSFWGFTFGIADAVIDDPYDFIYNPDIFTQAAGVGVLWFLAFFTVITLLVVSIVGIVQAKKNDFPIVGHILNLVGAAVGVSTFMMFSFISIVLFIIGMIFLFIAKPREQLTDNTYQTF